MSSEARPKLIGAGVTRLEDPRLLTGQGTFVDDLAPQRVVHIALRRSDQAHARIPRVDTDGARRFPRCRRKVFTERLRPRAPMSGRLSSPSLHIPCQSLAAAGRASLRHVGRNAV
jgi:CO/xanthine dehydrogenase Mo-binding subunit